MVFGLRLAFKKQITKPKDIMCLKVSQLEEILLMEMEERGKRKEERGKRKRGIEKGDTIEKIGSTQGEEEEEEEEEEE